MNDAHQTPVAGWKTWTLRLASVHCLVWGTFIIVSPQWSARVYGFGDQLTDLFLWSGCGLMIALLGLGYGIASTNPSRHIAVVILGLLAKILGPIGMLLSVYQGEVPTAVLWLLPFNDLIWWIPLAIIVCEELAVETRPATQPEMPLTTSVSSSEMNDGPVAPPRVQDHDRGIARHFASPPQED